MNDKNQGQIQRQGLYSIHDKNAGIYYAPRVYAGDVMAVRDHQKLFRNVETDFNRWPDEFELVMIAEFEPKTGEVFHIKHKVIVQGTTLVGNEV